MRRQYEREIADWLSEAADPLEVIIEMDRWVAVIVIQIWSVNRLFRTKLLSHPTFRTGRPSGQADAVFASHRDARRAGGGPATDTSSVFTTMTATNRISRTRKKKNHIIDENIVICLSIMNVLMVLIFKSLITEEI